MQKNGKNGRSYARMTGDRRSRRADSAIAKNGSCVRGIRSRGSKIGSTAREIGSPAREIGSRASGIRSRAREIGSYGPEIGSPAREIGSRARGIRSPAREIRSLRVESALAHAKLDPLLFLKIHNISVKSVSPLSVPCIDFRKCTFNIYTGSQMLKKKNLVKLCPQVAIPAGKEHLCRVLFAPV